MQVCQVLASSSLRFLGRRILNIFRKFTLYFAPSTNQVKRFGQKSYETWKLLKRHICEKKVSNISSETADTVNFHFSHYKSMGTISCHSNQSSYPTGIKNTTYIEANVLSMYAKFRLHPSYGF